jgi:hypothetical protein
LRRYAKISSAYGHSWPLLHDVSAEDSAAYSEKLRTGLAAYADLVATFRR